MYADAELRLGRPLTLGERNIDIVALDNDLNRGKERLAAEIDKEKRRALNAYFRYRRTIKLNVTDGMVGVLRSLYRQGREHGRNEIKQLAGVVMPKTLSEKDDIDKMIKKLHGQLRPFQAKVVGKAVEADIGSMAEIAATRAVLQMPGALNVASQLVSSAVFSGIGSVYSEAAGLFGSWTYSAVMDEGTCDECEGRDGEEFESWDAIMDVLPDGGPNPECMGEGRCRCRAVPSSASEESGVGGILPTGDVATADESAGIFEGDLTPRSDFPLLPKHARQPVETLGRDDAEAQLKKIEGNIRGLHWHAKNGRPINPEKLAAYERRKVALQTHIRGGTAPRPVEPPVAPPVAPPEPMPRVEPAPTPFVAPGNPFVGQTAIELKAALTKRGNQIAGLKKQIKAIEQATYDPHSHPRYLELRTRLTKLEAERERVREAIKVAPEGMKAPVIAPAGERASAVKDYFYREQQPTRRSKAYETREHVDAGMSMMDKVFVKYHDGSTYQKINLDFTVQRSSYGKFYKFSSGQPQKISMASGTSFSDTFWHEFGHYIDFANLDGARAGAFLSETAGSDLAPVLDAIRSSKAWDKIKEPNAYGIAHARYLAQPREMFARAFAQYMQTKAEMLGEDGLLSETEAIALQRSRAKLNTRAGTFSAGEQWEAGDFTPIFRALDKFFHDRGWLGE